MMLLNIINSITNTQVCDITNLVYKNYKILQSVRKIKEKIFVCNWKEINDFYLFEDYLRTLPGNTDYLDVENSYQIIKNGKTLFIKDFSERNKKIIENFILSEKKIEEEICEICLNKLNSMYFPCDRCLKKTCLKCLKKIEKSCFFSCPYCRKDNFILIS